MRSGPVTTEDVLRAGLGLDDAHELFEWLRGLSFVEARPDGVFPHDLAPDALVAVLRWRDPESFQALFRGVSAHILERLKMTQGREQQRVLFDAKYLHRYQPVSRTMSDWDALGHHYPEAATPEDDTAILELARGWEGPESAALVARWFDRQPGGFWVVRRHDAELRGSSPRWSSSARPPTTSRPIPAAGRRGTTPGATAPRGRARSLRSPGS